MARNARDISHLNPNLALCCAAGPVRKGTIPYHVYRETVFRTLKTTKSLRVKEASWH
jgi:hypothetical protein